MSSAKPVSLYGHLRKLAPVYAVLFGLSFFAAILRLVPPLYLMQVHERVFNSRNVDTLIFLTIIAVFLVLVSIALRSLRDKACQRMALRLDEKLRGPVFDAVHRTGRKGGDAPRYLADLDSLRSAVGGPFIGAFFDTLLSPIFLFVLFLIHPVFGLMGIGIMIATGLLALINQRLARAGTERSQRAHANAWEFATATVRNSDAVRAMGMLPGLGDRWETLHRTAVAWQADAQRQSAPVMAVLRFIQSMKMIGVVGVGAFLYIDDQVTAGGTFAAMIIMLRGLGPIDSVVANWRSIVLGRLAAKRLDDLLQDARSRGERVQLPVPKGLLTAERLTILSPTDKKPVVREVSFGLGPGRVLAIIGSSGAGKSSLLRGLAGVWPAASGSVAVDGHNLSHWDPDQLGRFLGYMPQDIEMLPGTVAENIARFYPDRTRDERLILEAAQTAEVMDLIQSLPEGFNTRLGASGQGLSGGQRQRLGLARALFGKPPIVLLDEPNASLDAKGEEALFRTIERLKERQTTVVIVTHKLNMLPICDDVLVMHAGALHAYGQRDDIVRRLPQAQGRAVPLKVIEGSG
ncbi:MAG: type I secretion system permease/ATPase [Pseudomonadota bacterium]